MIPFFTPASWKLTRQLLVHLLKVKQTAGQSGCHAPFRCAHFRQPVATLLHTHLLMSISHSLYHTVHISLGSTKLSTLSMNPQTYKVSSFVRHIRKVAKSDYYLRHACPPASHRTTLLPLNGFTCNFMWERCHWNLTRKFKPFWNRKT
jgi:hypothetical protein